MRMSNSKSIWKYLGIGVIAIALLSLFVAAGKPSDVQEAELGGVYNTRRIDFAEGISVDNTVVVDGSRNVQNVQSLQYRENDETVSSSTTLTTADSGKTFYMSNTATSTITLPAVASSAGVVFRFVTAGTMAGDMIIDSAEGDNMEGSLIVAGAVVDCAAEDQVNFVGDGENLGDFLEIRSEASKWYITQSNALTSAKLTCTDPS